MSRNEERNEGEGENEGRIRRMSNEKLMKLTDLHWQSAQEIHIGLENIKEELIRRPTK